MSDAPPPDDLQTDAGLTLLKWLVVGLTGTMMVGLIVLIVLFVTRFPSPGAPLPETLALPEGLRATAFTRGSDWVAVVSDTDEILIYDLDGETLLQRIQITR